MCNSRLISFAEQILRTALIDKGLTLFMPTHAYWALTTSSTFTPSTPKITIFVMK
jgi:hypothetical protein